MVAESLEQARSESIDREDEKSKQEEKEQLVDNFNNNCDIQDISHFLEWKEELNSIDPALESKRDIILSRLETQYLKDVNFFDINEELNTIFYWWNINWYKTSGIDIDNKDEIYNELLITISNNHNEAHEDKYENPEKLNETERKLESQEYLRDSAYERLSSSITSIPGDLESTIDKPNSEQLEKYLEKNSVKEDNIKKWETLIYNDNFISTFFSKDPEQKKLDEEFFNYPEVKNDLKDILSNFLVNTDKDKLSDVDKWDLEQINIALNSAFDIKIAELLDGKVNYPEITINTMIKEIRDWNPFEKIETFEALKQIVNNNEWKSWIAMEKWKINIVKSLKLGQTILEKYFKEIQLQIKENHWNIELINELKIELENILLEKNELISTGEIFEWDISLEWNEKWLENWWENK
jgi:hypothetical protein